MTGRYFDLIHENISEPLLIGGHTQCQLLRTPPRIQKRAPIGNSPNAVVIGVARFSRLLPDFPFLGSRYVQLVRFALSVYADLNRVSIDAEALHSVSLRLDREGRCLARRCLWGRRLQTPC